MTDQPKADDPSADAPVSEGARPRDADWPEERKDKSFFQLIPRRDLTMIGLLLVVLMAVVMLRGRAGGIVQGLTRSLSDPHAAPAPPREAPRVKLAPGPK